MNKPHLARFRFTVKAALEPPHCDSSVPVIPGGDLRAPRKNSARPLPEVQMSSKRSQIQKNTYYVIPFL